MSEGYEIPLPMDERESSDVASFEDDVVRQMDTFRQVSCQREKRMASGQGPFLINIRDITPLVGISAFSTRATIEK